MQIKQLFFVCSIILSAVFGCSRKLERGYCEANYANPNFLDREECCNEYPEDCQPPGGMCETADDCGFASPHCRADGVCVQCLKTAHCVTAERPICDENSNACVACRGHADCDTQLCLSDGTCAAEDAVVYVSDMNASDAGPCSKEAPCQTLSQALTLITAQRKHIKIAGRISTPMGTRIDAKDVTIHGDPGTSSITCNAGTALDIGRAAIVSIYDLEIIGSMDKEAVKLSDAMKPQVSMTRVKVRAPSGNGITVSEGDLVLNDSDVYNCSGIGIDLAKGSLIVRESSDVFDNLQEGIRAASGTTLEIRRSSIRGNRGVAGISTTNAMMLTLDSSVVARNTGTNGGVSVMGGRFEIVNSIIARNTGDTSGGLFVNSTNGLVDFSTIANNNSDIAGNAGIGCVSTVIVSNSVLTGNNSTTPISLSCMVTHSLTGTVPPALPGTGNMVGDPMFLNVLDPLDREFFRIGMSSAARGIANSTTPLNVDIDGQARDDGAKDMGADEYK